MNTTGRSGTTRVARLSMTAACAPKLELSTRAPGNSATAQAMRSSAETRDSRPFTAARSTAGETRSAVAICQFGQQQKPEEQQQSAQGASWTATMVFMPEGQTMQGLDGTSRLGAVY